MKKEVVVLGSTGSVGTRELALIEQFPERYRVVGLSAKHNTDLLAEQIKRFKPKVVGVAGLECPDELEALAKKEGVTLLHRPDANVEIAEMKQADYVIIAISGLDALAPAIGAIRMKKRVGMANKEALVAAGRLLVEEAEFEKAELIPIDSEHWAIYQCLKGEKTSSVERIILTASGGPFFDWPMERLETITPAQALEHPVWPMGKKITIDSATMMNKGLECIEAMHLFQLSPSKINVKIHPQCLIHGMVEFTDATLKLIAAPPTMDIPIAYALRYPKRLKLPVERLRLSSLEKMDFLAVDMERFPAFGHAMRAAETGEAVANALNGADDEVVNAFLSGAISFLDIARILGEVVDLAVEEFGGRNIESFDDVYEFDAFGRSAAKGFFKTS